MASLPPSTPYDNWVYRLGRLGLHLTNDEYFEEPFQWYCDNKTELQYFRYRSLIKTYKERPHVRR